MTQPEFDQAVSQIPYLPCVMFGHAVRQLDALPTPPVIGWDSLGEEGKDRARLWAYWFHVATALLGRC